jgi:putative (di)nucleoside polyphosphate hydrolase
LGYVVESGAGQREVLPAVTFRTAPGGKMIDVDGYRPNVGIVLLNADGRLFWARRIHRDGWQFPQGGMRSDETPLEAMYRELAEETGLAPEHVEVLAATRGWLRYRLPNRFVRHHQRPTCIGQKQVWFLLKLVGGEDALKLDLCDDPEFDIWRWVDFWYPAAHVVNFKRQVYERALRHFAPLVEGLFNVELGTVPTRSSAAAPDASHDDCEAA